MGFANPWALLGLLSIPVILVMYLLKQKYTERVIPSLFLWKQALSVTESRKPWQKFRKNILFFLQIILAVMLSFALARPYFAGMNSKSDMIIVIDGSMSMQTEEGSATRFDIAKTEAKKMAESLIKGQQASVVLMDGQPSVVCAFTEDKQSVISTINALEATYTEADEAYTSELVKSITEIETKEAVITIFTDKLIDFPFFVNTFVIGENTDNTAVIFLSYTIDTVSEKISALARVANYGENVVTNALALYADGEIFDIVSFTLQPLEELELLFTQLPPETETLTAKLTESDNLIADDIRYECIYRQNKEKVLLFTEKNIFLENILYLLPNVELYKGDLENIETVKGYYLYIFDGVLPEKVPTDGHLLLFNPPVGNNYIEIGEEVAIDSITKMATGMNLMDWMSELDFAVAKTKLLTTPEWAETVLMSEGEAIVFAGTESTRTSDSARKTAVFGFDLHDTDLPLRKEFPIFMNNLCEWFIPSKTIAGSYFTGDTAAFQFNPSAESIEAISPDNEKTVLAPPFPALAFTQTNKPGIYSLLQKMNGSEENVSFAVNVNTNESDLRRETGITSGTYTYDKEGYAEIQVKDSFINNDFSGILLCIALLIFVAEWWVYNRVHTV